jgi:hypothetical protein
MIQFRFYFTHLTSWHILYQRGSSTVDEHSAPEWRYVGVHQEGFFIGDSEVVDELSGLGLELFCGNCV